MRKGISFKNENNDFDNINYNDLSDEEMEIEEDYELDPPRPELINIKSQTLLLLKPIPNSPPHPRTVYLLYDPQLNDNHYDNKYSFSEIEIKERKYMVLYKAYKNFTFMFK